MFLPYIMHLPIKRKQIIFVVACFQLVGCSLKLEFPVHGNFCGPGHPIIKAKTLIEQKNKLQSIFPIDDIDMACKSHDICYLEKGYLEKSCDEKLVDDLTMHKYGGKEYTDNCRGTVRNIRVYFDHIHPSFFRKEDKYKNNQDKFTEQIITFPILGLELLFSGMDYLIFDPISYVFFSNNKTILEYYFDQGQCFYKVDVSWYFLKRGYEWNNAYTHMYSEHPKGPGNKTINNGDIEAYIYNFN